MNLKAKLQELKEAKRKVKVIVEGLRYPLKGTIREVGDDYVKVGDTLVAIKAVNAVIPIKEIPRRRVDLSLVLGEEARALGAQEEGVEDREDEAVPEATESGV